jgi:signal transduction histidine kinase
MPCMRDGHRATSKAGPRGGRPLVLKRVSSIGKVFQGSCDVARLLDSCNPKSLAAALVVAFVLAVVPAYIPLLYRVGGFRAPWVVFGLFCCAVCFSYLFYRTKGQGRWAPVFTLTDTFLSQLALSIAVVSTDGLVSFAYAGLQGYLISGVYARCYSLSVLFAAILGAATVGAVAMLDGLTTKLFVVSCAYVLGLWIISFADRERRMASQNVRLRNALTLTDTIATRSMDLALTNTTLNVASLLHELRNHLSVIGVNLAFLSECTMPTEETDAVRDARQGFERARMQLENCLDKMRRARMARPPFEAVPVIKDTVSACQESARIEEVADVARPMLVAGDADDLRCVLDNLLRNALQAGATLIRVRCLAPEGDSTLLIEVEDDGKGVEEELIDTLWEPFVTSRPNDSGTGLGLYIVRRRVELMGGALEADSSPNGGLVVRLCFPAVRSECTESMNALQDEG